MGMVDSRRKIQRAQTQGPGGGATSGAWGGAATIEKGYDR